MFIFPTASYGEARSCNWSLRDNPREQRAKFHSGGVPNLSIGVYHGKSGRTPDVSLWHDMKSRKYDKSLGEQFYYICPHLASNRNGWAFVCSIAERLLWYYVAHWLTSRILQYPLHWNSPAKQHQTSLLCTRAWYIYPSLPFSSQYLR